MKTASKPFVPSASEVGAELGPAIDVWQRIIEVVSDKFAPVEQAWKPSKSGFGGMCLLKQKKRTLLYLTPEKGHVRVAIVLGERSVTIALESELPDEIKRLIRDARPYAEGRGIRFDVNSLTDVSMVIELINIKTTPK